ncbi:male-enhanced antigen 1 [Dendroctonus ponderosae]|uniref:Male-enhanced antigen 1 n=1 Tax=Dendroctonus ponderosae TaxID=77166 RepID=U4UNY2_DENPD|nr:male-enhanced antigen 1 [Dendroctonus ponderosae]ERL91740.1 hypothetical protein D910_09066 [Dendroctonus ponderosae]
MGKRDTGLSNAPANDTEIAENRELAQPRAEEDSDSELEDNGPWGGYMPLAQNPADSEALFRSSNDSDEDEGIDEEQPPAAEQGIKDSSSVQVEEVWSQPAPKEVDIEMSDKKIDLVKQMMQNIKLPEEAIPAWARDIPEAQWRDHLLQKLNQAQQP